MIPKATPRKNTGQPEAQHEARVVDGQWLEDELAIIEIKAYVATKHEQQGDFREGNERACHASPREGDLMQHQTVDAESDGDGECSVDDDGG